MGTIESVRTEEVRGIVVVDRVVDEVDVGSRTLEARKGVGNRAVQMAHEGKGTSQVGGEFHLHGVVDGAAYGFEELDLAKIGVLAGERNLPLTHGEPACPEVSVGEAIIGVIGDGCSSRDGAANACRTTSRTAAKGGIGGSDRRQSAVRVQKVRVTNVVFIDGQQSVRA